MEDGIPTSFKHQGTIELLKINLNQNELRKMEEDKCRTEAQRASWR